MRVTLDAADTLAGSPGIVTTFQRNVVLSARYSIAVKTWVPSGSSGCSMVIASSNTGSKSCRTKIFFSLRLMKIAMGDFLIGGVLATSAGLASAGDSGAAMTGVTAARAPPLAAGACTFESGAAAAGALASAAASGVASGLTASAAIAGLAAS